MPRISFSGAGARYDNSSALLSENFFLAFSRPEPTVDYNGPGGWSVKTNLPTGTVGTISFSPVSSFTPQPGETPPLGAVGSIALFDPFGSMIARFTELAPGLQVADYIANPNLLMAGDDEFDGSLGNDVINLGDGDDWGWGRAGDDVLRGGSGDDVLLPDAGDDTLDGGDGFDIVEYSIVAPAMFVDLSTQTVAGVEADGDTIMNIEGFIAGGGDDVLFGDEGANLLDGHTGDDYIEGRGGDDILIASYLGGNSALYGGDGDDRLVTAGSGVPGNLFEGGAGADELVGGVGFDAASYASSDAGVTINLTTNEASGGHATGDVLSGIEHIIGSAFDDVLTGEDLNGINDGNGLFGGAGNDVIIAGAGYDELYGEEGSDVLIGGADNDDMEGGDGNDQLQGDDGSDILLGGLGDDVLDGGDGVDNLFGGDGSDTLSGGAFHDNLDGGAGDDRLTDSDGDNHFWGGDGNDVLVGGSNGSSATMSGDSGSDILIGGDSRDSLEGGEGNDLLDGRAGEDHLVGGEGIDVADFGAAGGAVTVDLATGSARESYLFGQLPRFWEDTLTGIENVFGSAFSDVLTGDGGDNLLRGGAGADTLSGGAGFDTVDYSSSAAAVIVDLAAQTASGGDASGDALSGFERVVGTAFDDSLAGDGGANVLRGGEGADTLAGGAGADLLEGGAGDDLFVHGAEAGADAIFGGVDGQDSGVDTLTFSTAGAGVVVQLSGEATTFGGALLATFSGIERVVGSAFADAITGTAGADLLVGGGGADLVSGGAGNDWFVQDLVGAGGDRLFGEAGFDTIDYRGASSGVTVQLTGYAVHAGATIALFSGIEAAIGSAFNDALIGDAGNNRLAGGAGADWLVGQAGDDWFVQGIQAGAPDRLFGDAGIDTIDYGAANAAVVVQLSGYSTSGGVTLATFAGIENAVGTNVSDVIVGDGASNRIAGGDGADWLVGGAGDDVFVQSDLGGGDRLFGDAGFDTLDYSAVGAPVTVQLSGYVVAQGVTLSTFAGIEGAIGTAFNDALIGTAADNRLAGGAGADWLVGGGGADAVDGGEGDDRLVMRVDAAVDTLAGGAGHDILDYSSGGEGVVVQLSGYSTTLAGALLATFTGLDSALGTSFDDALIGNASNNVLTGGLGSDWLVGAGGADAFVYRGVESTIDTIADFSRIQGDRIDLSPFGSNGPGLGDSVTFAFSSTRTAGVSEQVVATNFGNSSLVSLYLDADDIADMTIQVVHDPGLVMNAGDFIL